MYVLIAGGGKVGANLARSLLRGGNEVTLIEQRPYRFDKLEAEFEHQVIRGDATELFVLERAGIKRPPDLLVAATGDDEDNIVICQLAREKYGVAKVIARINDPRNQPYFDLLGISPTVSATGVDHGADRARGAGARPDPPARAAEGEPRDRRGLDRQGRELQGQARPRAPAARGRAADLGRPRRQGRDPGRRDAAPGRRPGAGDPGARQGGRAPPHPAELPTPYSGRRYRGGVRRPATPVLLAWFATARRPALDHLGADAGDGEPRRPRAAASCRPASPTQPARSCSRSGSAWSGSRAASRGASAAPGGWRVAVVAASAVAHLAKGLDFEEATVHLILLVALLRARRQFVAPGDPATILPLAQVGAALRAVPAAPDSCTPTTTTPSPSASRRRCCS